jgi:hypothetical protein
MKARGLVGLAVVAAALGAILLIDARHGPSSGSDRAGARERLLPPFDRKTVRRIEIRRRGAAPFVLVHAASPSAPAPGWRVELPNTPAADDAAIEELLAAADLSESNRVADISADAAGLQPAAVEVDIEAAAGALSAQLGRADAAGQGVYARAGAQGPIRVVSRRLLELADREPAAFRDHRLFPLDPTAVTSIAWLDGAGSGELHAVDGRWQNGHKEWVDEGRVVEAMRRLFALRIDRFDVPPRGHTGTPRTLTMTAGTAQIALELETGDAAGEITRGSEHVHVPADALEAATRALTAAAARDTRLVAMTPDTVTRIDLFDDRGRVGLRRVDGAWAFSTPKLPYAADTRVVDEWLARLGAIRTATRADGAHARHLILDGRFRQAIDVSAPPDVYALLAPDPLRFRERTLLSFARFDVRRLQRQAGKTIEVLTSEDGTVWRTPSGRDVDAANAARVAGVLSELRAEEFVAAPPANVGDAQTRLEIDVQPPGETHAARHVVQLWTFNDGGCVARVSPEGEATFKPERSACEALRLDLLKKADY